MTIEEMAAKLNKVIEMCARSLGVDSEEVVKLEDDFYCLVHGIYSVEDFFWVEQMLGEN